MTQKRNMNENENTQYTDPSTWTAYGDPLKNGAESNREDEYQTLPSPMIEKAKQDGNIVKKE